MGADRNARITIRDAQAADISALMAIRGDVSEALHQDRLRDSQNPGFRYMVLLKDQEVIGFACLVFRRPLHWSDADDTEHLPQIVDLRVQDSQRGQGYGSEFVRALEHATAAAGFGHLYLSVEANDNPRAYALYQRLGYQSLQCEPYHQTWAFTDSLGQVHQGENWIIDMVKQL